MAALAVHVLLELFNEAPCSAERVFDFPKIADVTRSLETASPLGDFALVLATAPFELQYFTLARMLEEGGVPALAEERVEGDPVVVVGGPAVSANPAPVAAMADLAYVGEIEAQAAAVRAALMGVVPAGGGREETIAALAGVPGMLDCRAWLAGRSSARVSRQWGPVDQYVPRSVIVAPEAELSGRALIEVARGCPYGCKFCLARGLYHPLRPRSAEVLVRAMQEMRPVAVGVGLVATSFADHPQASELLEEAMALGLGVSVSSLRVDRVGEKPRLVELLARAGQRTLTLAPEAGSERLRRAIGKPLSDEQIAEAAAVVAGAGVPNLKLYFMIGLPGESDEDVEGIGDLLRRLRQQEPTLELSASVACFVPKGHTAFQREAMADDGVLRVRANLLRRLCGRFGVSLEVGSVRLARAQAVLARGGLELAPLVPAVARDDGPEAALQAAIEQEGYDPTDYGRFGSPDPGWRVVDVGCG